MLCPGYGSSIFKPLFGINNMANVIIIITTLFESQIILAGHKCYTNWGDCKSNQSNQIKSIVGF